MQGPERSEFFGRVSEQELLGNGRLVGIQSFSSVVTDLITNSTKHELLVMKGNPTSSTIITKHNSVSGNPTLTSDSDSVTLDISFVSDLPKGIYKYIFDVHFSSPRNIKLFLYGECGGVGYRATTWYTHWNNNYQGNERQNNFLGGYFHWGYGNAINFSEEFRHLGGHLTNLGTSRALNSAGIFNEFLVQKLEKVSSEPKLLGLHMTWLFENETPSQALNMTGARTSTLSFNFFFFTRNYTLSIVRIVKVASPLLGKRLTWWPFRNRNQLKISTIICVLFLLPLSYLNWRKKSW